MGDAAGGAPFCMGPGHVMMGGWQLAHGAGQPCALFLFKGWVVDSPGKYAAAVMGIFLLGCLHAALQLLLQWCAQRLKQSTKWRRGVATTLVYGARMFVAECMMLLVMLYEWTFLLALLLGLMAGYLAVQLLEMDGEEATRLIGRDSYACNNTDLPTTPCCE